MPAPGELYTVDGRKMHLQRSGPAPANAQQPTLVIEAGGGCASPIYARLQQALSAKHPVISYDRAGMGWSEADDAPFDGERNAQRLHALLAAAGVTGPIVLIGHSLGGLLNRIYTGLYPAQVAGVVMLDSSHPAQFEVFEGLSPELLAPERVKRAAFQAGGPPPPEFAPVQAIFADMPHVLRQMKLPTTRRKRIDTMLKPKCVGLPHVARQAGASPDLGARPLSCCRRRSCSSCQPGAEDRGSAAALARVPGGACGAVDAEPPASRRRRRAHDAGAAAAFREPRGRRGRLDRGGARTPE
jgi:pimeloyl-ACP methyl ester carboxylesterase